MTKTDWKISSHHRTKYGEWAGNPCGRRADPERCAEEVYSGHLFYQCSRKRGHGPQSAFCKQHSPEAKQARAAKQKAKYNAKMDQWRERRLNAELKDKALELIKEIAAGHNNPRGAALELLESHNATPQQHETATPAEKRDETDV